MNKSILIIGFGKMGHLYSKYLTELNIRWTYHDPFVPGGLKKLTSLNKYSHIIISTPPENHHEVYKLIVELGFKGYVYIDKPVIVKDEHFDILDEVNVFCGMTERFNPAIKALKNLLNLDELTSIKFSRYSTVPDNMNVPVLFDLGVHDLDLYLYLLGFKECPLEYNVFEKERTCYIMAKQHDILSIFEWSHDSQKRERKITILQKDVVYEADLIDQTILFYGPGQVCRNLYVDKAQPLKQVLKAFLNNEKCFAKLSHEFMLAVMQVKWNKDPI